MKSITIHDLDPKMEALIREKARKGGTSLNKTIKSLLRKSLGLDPGCETDRGDDFADLFGIWTEKDEGEFKKRNLSYICRNQNRVEEGRKANSDQ